MSFQLSQVVEWGRVLLDSPEGWLIMLAPLIALTFAISVVQMILKWRASQQLEQQKRKNDFAHLAAEKPKNDDPPPAIGWFIGDDGELVEKSKRG